MTKYNLSKIMSRAWEIKRQDSRYIFGMCLEMAWAEAKAPAKKTFNGCALVEADGCGMKQFKLWSNYGKHRIYINREDGRKSYGYIDLDNGNKIVCDSGVKWAVIPAVEEFFNVYSIALAC